VKHIQERDSLSGVLYALGAYGSWGLVPLYFQALGAAGVSVWEILAHRIVWSLLLLALVLTASRQWTSLVVHLRQWRTGIYLLATAALLAINWCVFIYGVNHDQVVETSLGYFINPLVSVVLGMLFLGERLRPGQWLALLLAGAGLVYRVYAAGTIPWIGLVLACSFGTYGLLRKLAPIHGLLALTAEMFLLLPGALVFLIDKTANGTGAFGESVSITVLLLFSSLVTVVPLFCFGQAVRHLRMSTLGFLQYIGPTTQFLIAVLALGESFGPQRQVSFGLIWAGLAVFSVEAFLLYRSPGGWNEPASPQMPDWVSTSVPETTTAE
jgi:chloramphenicol-sensitive protein RarD